VIRLSPYCPDLNSIEKIWSSVKSRIAAKNFTFKPRDVQQLAENFAAVTEEESAAVWRHVKTVEEEYIK